MRPSNPRAEAQAMVGEGYDARVLEPSPPAMNEAPWFADDPVWAEPVRAPVVAPVGGDLTWDEWADRHPEHRGWVAERWLGAWPTLGEPPATFEATRRSLHELVTHVVTPARYRANGKIGLRWTRGGFGTPFYGDDEQVRLEGGRLVVQRKGSVRVEELTTLASAAETVLGGPPDLGWAADLELHDPPENADPDRVLAVDPVAAGFLAGWMGMAWSVLEDLRADAASAGAGRVQLWPEHFDAAVDIGQDAGRASYGWSPGFSPGEGPYVYVSLWSPDSVPDDPRWNATTFRGAQIALGEFAGKRRAALDWLRAIRDALGALDRRA